MPLLDAILRGRYLLLATLAAALLAASWAGTPEVTDWTFFSWGSETLFGAHRDFVRGSEVISATGSGGLHLYADYPFLQIGPPALLVARLLEFGPGQGVYAASALIQVVGLAVVVLLVRAVPRERLSQAGALVGGALVLGVWTSLAHTRHLDDAVALAAIAGATLALRGDKFLLCGALLGLAAASKPWAVVAVPLTLGFPLWSHRARAGLLAVAVIAIFWLPFVLADPDTLRLGQVHLQFARDSAPAALGARSVSDPQALRLLQIAGGFVLAMVLVGLRAWYVAVLAAFALRLLIEPFPYQYYTASLITAAFMADLVHNSRIPLMTMFVAGSWAVVALSPLQAAGLIRAATYVGLILGALAISQNQARLRAARR